MANVSDRVVTGVAECCTAWTSNPSVGVVSTARCAAVETANG
jgi:hypothetical protein